MALIMAVEILKIVKCIKQLVQNAVMNVKFHLNLHQTSLFIAKNAIKKEKGINSFEIASNNI